MTNKLCPYCGEEPEQCGTAWLMCQTIGCPNRASTFTPEQWNRRFVCLDKNGDKVFVGDKVRAWLGHTEIIEGETPYDEGVMWWDNKMLLWRIAIKGRKYEKKLFGTFYEEIELIKEIE